MADKPKNESSPAGKRIVRSFTKFGSLAALLSLVLYPAQLSGMVSQAASYTAGKEDCSYEVNNFKSAHSESTAGSPTEAPLLYEPWVTKSEQFPGRIDIHIRVDPGAITNEEEYGLVVAGKYGKQSPGSFAGFGEDYDETPPTSDTCTKWWMYGPKSDADRSYEFEVVGAWANREYCFVVSKADQWKRIGSKNSQRTRAHCITPRWNINWGLIMS